VLIGDPIRPAGLEGLVFQGFEIGQIVVKDPAARRSGLRLLQALRQLGFARCE
jgi:hypothetical protein